MSNQSPEIHRKLVGSRLREAREFAGLSQEQAAQLLKLHRPTISEIEAGRRKVSTQELLQFAGLYDATPAYLLGQTAEVVEIGNPKIRMAARELEKLPTEALDGLLRMLATFQDRDDESKS